MSYTSEELAMLAYVPQMIGSAVAAASGSGLFGTGKELFASASSVLEGVKSFPNNALIKQLVPDPAVDRTKAMEQMKKTRDWAMARIKAKGVDSADKLKTQIIEDTKAAAAILASKASATEADEYRQWAMSVAEKVAKASSEGGFLGFGGEQVTAAEKALIEEIRLALGAAASEIKEDKVTTGDLGPGRKMQPKVGANVKAKATITSRPLLGRKVMITAGPTQEPIDMTHFIVNHSSGEQGYLLAEVAVALGAETVLVSGPVNLPLPPGAQVRMANTASDMLEICEQELPCDIAIFAAAVSKWRMAGSPEKLEVQIGGVRELKLIENPDISKIIATRTDKRPAIVIELTAETADVIETSRKKLLTKSCDLILVHDVGDSSGMFRADSNTLHLISAHQVETWPRLSKREVAQRLMAMLAAKLAPR